MAGPGAEAMEEHCSLTFPQGLLSLLFYITQGHLPTIVPTTAIWTFPHQSLNQEDDAL